MFHYEKIDVKKTISILILALTFFKVYSQISIGNSSLLNSDVILDLTDSNNRALLLPSKTNTLPTGPQGVMIFDSDDDMIFYSEDGSNLTLAPGGFLHSEKLILIDQFNRIRGYYDGTDSLNIPIIIQHIQSLL